LLDTVVETAKEKDAQAAYFAENGTLAGYQGRALVTDADSLVTRIDELTKKGKPQTPAQQAQAASVARAQQAAFEYVAKRRAPQTQ
jgi:hypothetical protein